MTDDPQNPFRHSAPADAQSGIAYPLICLAIGVFCIVFPETILDSPAYAELPKQAFGAAFGLLFVAAAIGGHAHSYWGRRGYSRVSHVGRLVGGMIGIGSFLYMFKCIVEVDGWPW